MAAIVTGRNENDDGDWDEKNLHHNPKLNFSLQPYLDKMLTNPIFNENIFVPLDIRCYHEKTHSVFFRNYFRFWICVAQDRKATGDQLTTHDSRLTIHRHDPDRKSV